MATQEDTRGTLLAPVPDLEKIPDPVPKAGTSKNRRDYKVVEELENGESFRKVGVYHVGDGKAAIRRAVKEHGLGTYIAVADSAWIRHVVTKKTHESLVLG